MCDTKLNARVLKVTNVIRSFPMAIGMFHNLSWTWEGLGFLNENEAF